MTPVQQAYVWVQGIIHSCETKFHYDAADVVIKLFGLQYPDNQEMKTMLQELKDDRYLDFKRYKQKAKA